MKEETISNKVEKILKKQNDELSFWRGQAETRATMGKFIGFFSFVILIVTLIIPLYLWSHRRLLPEINRAKSIIESWKEMSLLLTDIQLSIIQESLEMTPTNSLQINIDPIQGTILSLDITRSLQRLTSDNCEVIEEASNHLVQICEQLQRESKSKIRRFIAEVSDSEIVVLSPNKKLLKKLLSEFV